MLSRAELGSVESLQEVEEGQEVVRACACACAVVWVVMDTGYQKIR